jgi:two-component system phosphate regulon response regulator PhoB
MAAPQDNDAIEKQLQRLRTIAQPEMHRRLRVIERCVLTTQDGQPESRLLQAARREAHRLAGSLGVLGFATATDLARRLNLLLQGSSSFTPAQISLASELLVGLRRELSQPSSDEHLYVDDASPRTDQSARVLLAEDDETIAAAIRVSLRLDGVELLWARDGLEAIRLAHEHPIDLALLDFGLPLFDGLEVCRRLRSDPRLATIPIVLITGRNDPRHGTDGTAESCVTDYLAKPFQVSDLRHLVRTLLAIQRDESSA